MLALADDIAVPAVAYLAPQAAGGTWYPHSFLAPLAANEPFLSRALAQVGDVVDGVLAEGVAPSRIVLAGFSQGGCLGLEYAARNPKGLGGVAGLSAGLIGPLGMRRDDQGSLVGTRVLLGCSDIDGHIPLARVHETADVLGRMGAAVDARIYPGMGHTINADEIAALRAIVAGIAERPREKKNGKAA
jgi:predicted esterase